MQDLNTVKKTIEDLKNRSATLSGRKQQLQQHLDTVLLPKFEELGVTPTDIEATIKIEEEEVKKGYSQILNLINDLNKIGV